MKKLISAIISAAMLASFAAMPAFAGYTAADYDVAETPLTFDNGAVTNAIDDSPAYQTGSETEQVYATTIDSTKEFFFTFDFCMDNASGYFGTSSDSSKDNVGLNVTISAAGQLQTQTGSSSYQALGSVSVGEWYTAEIEGKTGAGAEYMTFRLYDSSGKSVQETSNLNMRNLTSNGRHFTYLKGSNISFDNIYAVQLYPDTIAISSASEEVNAGQSVTLDYTMTRASKEMTKYDVTWAVYDEQGNAEITDDSVAITTEGVLTPDIKCPDKTVTVKASVSFGEKTLTGEKKITINAVNTADEPFDKVTIDGADSLKAGTSAALTFTAEKNGSDVTDSLGEGDAVWSVYNCDNLMENGNKGITIDNGTLTVADGILPQDIYVRVSTKSGFVYGAKKVSIEMSDSQIETVIYSDACETVKDGTERVDSVDGSKAYSTSSAVGFTFTDQANYVLTELDIKFGEAGSGFRIKRADGDEASSFIINSGNLSQQTGGSSYSVLYASIDTSKWYHVEVMYKAATSDKSDNVSMNLYEWNETGTEYTLKHTASNLNDRNGKNYGKLEIQAGTCVDNIKISTPLANEIKVEASGKTVFAGETAQFTVTASRNGLPFTGTDGITWTVLDEKGLPIIDDTVTVNNGLLTVGAMASAGTVTVRASSGANYGEASIEVAIAEIFTVSNIGINEDGSKIVRIYADKNFYYDDDVCFIIVIRDSNGILKGVKTVKTFGDRLNIGANEIAADMTLPADFNSETDSVEVMVWTAM